MERWLVGPRVASSACGFGTNWPWRRLLSATYWRVARLKDYRTLLGLIRACWRTWPLVRRDKSGRRGLPPPATPCPPSPRAGLFGGAGARILTSRVTFG